MNKDSIIIIIILLLLYWLTLAINLLLFLLFQNGKYLISYFK